MYSGSWSLSDIEHKTSSDLDIMNSSLLSTCGLCICLEVLRSVRIITRPHCTALQTSIPVFPITIWYDITNETLSDSDNINSSSLRSCDLHIVRTQIAMNGIPLGAFQTLFNLCPITVWLIPEIGNVGSFQCAVLSQEWQSVSLKINYKLRLETL